MSDKILCKFDNTYATLPGRFYEKVLPAKVKQPELLQFNYELADQLGVSTAGFSNEELAQIFSGQRLIEATQPIAMAYAGHQFGHFVPQLGDGRALLLGEIVTPKGQRFDIELKGSGVTPYSRRGDGLSAIGPVIREYIVSEAMFHLGVPTTRSLAAVSTGDSVYRETALPGAILTRVASSHIRVGHFEYFASRRDIEGLKALAQYSIHRHYPEVESTSHNSSDMYLAFLQKIIVAQASLIAHWMDIGFIHGVMNTDNMLISGETIDFGPCAFMDNFNFNQVFSSIDRDGRYAYINQAPIAQWNLARLAECLLLLVESDSKATHQTFESAIVNFKNIYEEQWLQRMRYKLGFLTNEPQDTEIVKSWLEYLHEEKLDYTISFRNLVDLLDFDSVDEGSDRAGKSIFNPTSKFRDFETQWRKRLQTQSFDHVAVRAKMNQVNPIYIPRNHQVERAIQGAISGDLSVFKEIIQVLKKPFQEQPGFEIYKQAPRPEERVTATFCGT